MYPINVKKKLVYFFILYLVLVFRGCTLVFYLGMYVYICVCMYYLGIMYEIHKFMLVFCLFVCFRTVILWKQLHMSIVQSAKRRDRSKFYGLTVLIFKSPFFFVKILRYYTN